MGQSMHMYVCSLLSYGTTIPAQHVHTTYVICAYVCTYIHTYVIYTYVRMCIFTYIGTYVHV